MDDNGKLLSRSAKGLANEKNVLKSQRRKLTLCLRRVTPAVAMEKQTWFHLGNNIAMSMTYSLMHINEVCKEHVDNNFRPLPGSLRDSLAKVSAEIVAVLREAS